MSVIIRIVQPPDYPHWRGLADVADLLYCAALDLGEDVRSSMPTCDDRVIDEDVIIFLGWHLLEPEWASRWRARRIIFYNLEQLAAREGIWTPEREQVLRQATEIWDYSPANIEFLAAHGFTNVKLVPIGYHPALKRIEHKPEAEKDIDVLFYGSVNDRRNRVLSAIEAMGLKTCVLFGVYGQARDRHIARAKIVLNMHFYETQLFEQVRVSYLLNNGCFVVSERSADTPDYLGGYWGRSYDQLPEVCRFLLTGSKMDVNRSALARLDADDFAEHPMTEYLRAVL